MSISGQQVCVRSSAPLKQDPESQRIQLYEGTGSVWQRAEVRVARLGRTQFARSHISCPVFMISSTRELFPIIGVGNTRGTSQLSKGRVSLKASKPTCSRVLPP